MWTGVGVKGKTLQLERQADVIQGYHVGQNNTHDITHSGHEEEKVSGSEMRRRRHIKQVRENVIDQTHPKDTRNKNKIK